MNRSNDPELSVRGERRRPSDFDPPRSSHIARAVRTWAMAIGILLLVTLLAASLAHADVLLRTCPTEPPETGASEFGACKDSTWSPPSHSSIVLVLRRFDASYRDVWESASTLGNDDRVWACDDSNVTPGPYVACPSKLPGLTGNWLEHGSIVWPQSEQPSGETYRVTYRWAPVSKWTDGSPITETVAYVLSWYGTDVSGTPNTQTTQVATAGPPFVLDAPRQRICASVRARVGDVASDESQSVCIAPQARRPGVPSSVTVEFGSGDNT